MINLLSDLWTIYLSVTGITISVITLLYSLALGKINEVKTIAEANKKGNKDPLLMSKKTFAENYTKEIKKTIKQCYYIFSLSLINFIICWCGFRLIPEEDLKATLYFIIPISIIILGLIISIVKRLYIQYKKEMTI